MRWAGEIRMKRHAYQKSNSGQWCAAEGCGMNQYHDVHHTSSNHFVTLTAEFPTEEAAQGFADALGEVVSKKPYRDQISLGVTGPPMIAEDEVLK